MSDYILEKEAYPIGKDLDGVEHTTEDLHQLLLKILLELDRVCRKNNIPYAIAYGSALGAYNYAGFIPWDDDIDAAIDYFDLPRLIEALKKDLSDEFTFDSYETDKRYNVLIPTIKIRYKESYLLEKNSYTLPNRCHNSDGFFLDVIALVGTPEDPKERKKILKYAKNRMPLYTFFDSLLRIHPHLIKKSLKKYERKIAEKYKDSKFVSQTPIIPFQDWGLSSHTDVYPKDIIYPFKEYDFEGHKIYSFNNIEEFCRTRYGEEGMKKWDGEKWYDPFPKEKRQFKHLVKYSLSRKKK
ncbi:MAG: LicD family protein [Bacilli bacterium]|nr:LicD family protein [Bacilli bacterium]